MKTGVQSLCNCFNILGIPVEDPVFIGASAGMDEKRAFGSFYETINITQLSELGIDLAKPKHWQVTAFCFSASQRALCLCGEIIVCDLAPFKVTIQATLFVGGG